MERSQPKSYFIDMDGVLMRGAAPIPGAADFVERLEERGAKFLLLTNNSMYTPRALQLRLENSGLRVPTDSIYTSAMATARFLQSQDPDGTVHAHGRGPELGRARRDGLVLVRSHRQGDAAGGRRRPLRGYQPGRGGTQRGRDNTRDGVGGGPDLERGRGASLLCRLAQPADDAHGPQRHRRALGGLGDDRGQHGHRHNHGPRERSGDGPGPLGGHRARRCRTLLLRTDPRRGVGRRDYAVAGQRLLSARTFRRQVFGSVGTSLTLEVPERQPCSAWPHTPPRRYLSMV